MPKDAVLATDSLILSITHPELNTLDIPRRAPQRDL